MSHKSVPEFRDAPLLSIAPIHSYGCLLIEHGGFEWFSDFIECLHMESVASNGFPNHHMGSHGFPWSPIARHVLQCSPWDSVAPDQILLVRTFNSLLFGFGLHNCKIAQPYSKVFEFGIFGRVVFECE